MFYLLVTYGNILEILCISTRLGGTRLLLPTIQFKPSML